MCMTQSCQWCASVYVRLWGMAMHPIFVTRKTHSSFGTTPWQWLLVRHPPIIRHRVGQGELQDSMPDKSAAWSGSSNILDLALFLVNSAKHSHLFAGSAKNRPGKKRKCKQLKIGNQELVPRRMLDQTMFETTWILDPAVNARMNA